MKHSPGTIGQPRKPLISQISATGRNIGLNIGRLARCLPWVLALVAAVFAQQSQACEKQGCEKHHKTNHKPGQRPDCNTDYSTEDVDLYRAAYIPDEIEPCPRNYRPYSCIIRIDKNGDSSVVGPRYTQPRLGQASPLPDTKRHCITTVQRVLQNKGFYRGAIDGQAGAATRSAIRRFQAWHGIPAHGQIDLPLLNALEIDVRIVG